MSWLTFDLYLPEKYHHYQKGYNFSSLLDLILESLIQEGITKKHIEAKEKLEDGEYTNITIKVRSSYKKTQYWPCPELGFLLIDLLKELRDPKFIKEDLEQICKERLKELQQHGTK